MPAAMASECAREQGKFWEMHGKIYDNQRALGDPELEGYAREIGLDVATWKECYTSNKYRERIQKDQATSMQLGARGTPAFFINGRFMSGAQSVDTFSALIDEELAKAKKSGVPREDYYEKKVLADGLTKVAAPAPTPPAEAGGQPQPPGPPPPGKVWSAEHGHWHDAP
jgi:hypothetical protein